MEIRKWTTVDVMYNAHEENLAIKEGKRLIKLGYSFEQTDAGGLFDLDDQYIKNGGTRLITETGRISKPGNKYFLSCNCPESDRMHMPDDEPDECTICGKKFN